MIEEVELTYIGPDNTEHLFGITLAWSKMTLGEGIVLLINLVEHSIILEKLFHGLRYLMAVSAVFDHDRGRGCRGSHLRREGWAHDQFLATPPGNGVG